MDNVRKPLPQAAPEEDRKPAAAVVVAEMLVDDVNPPKRRKTAQGGRDSGLGVEVVDVAAQLNFRPGDHIEVKWTINDDDSDEEGDRGSQKKEGKEVVAEKASDAGDDDGGNTVTVWWSATLSDRTDKTHTLTDEERQESEGAGGELYGPSQVVKLPIYSLKYAPLEEYGFETHSIEEVAFISNQTLLNLSTDEIMLFRKVGEPSPPSSPAPEGQVANAVDDSAVSREFKGQDEIRSFMSDLMQQCLAKTGMDRKMKSLPMSEQQAMAEKIRKAQEGMFNKLMEETDKMGVGNKVITGDVIRRCMAKMEGGY